MTTLDTPLWIAAGRYKPEADQRLLGALWPDGRIGGGDATRVTGTMNLSIAAGAVAVPMGDGRTVLCRWNAAEVFTVPAAPAAGQLRSEGIFVTVRPDDGDFIMQRIQGATAATNPAAPATPANSVPVVIFHVVGGQANLNNAVLFPRPSLHRLDMPGEKTLAYLKLTAAQARVSFMNIPEQFRHLQLFALVRSTNASEFTTFQGSLNGHTGNTHSYMFSQASGSSTTVISLANTGSMVFGNMIAATAGATADFAAFNIIIPFANYPGPPTPRNWLSMGHAIGNWTVTGSQQGQWRNGRLDYGTGRVTSFEVWPAAGNFAINSLFHLIGKEE